MSKQFTYWGSKTSQSHVTLDYTSPTWSLKSFDFDGTDNIFTGDSSSTTTINNMMTGSNKQFTISVWVKRNAIGSTQVIMCRDKSSATSQRQFLFFFTSGNKLVLTLYTNSTNSVQWTSTDNVTDTREWFNFTVVYDGTQAVTSRISVYKNGQAFAGASIQTGTFTTINASASIPAMNIGSRADAATFGNITINQVALFNTNLSAANVALIHNDRVPFDLRTNGTLNTNLVLFLSADASAVWTSSWAWTDLAGGAIFTSAGMVEADLVDDAPALKQVSVLMLHGQSNAVGRASAALPAQYQNELSWLKFWNGSGFENADFSTKNNNYGDHSTDQYGPEFFLGSLLNLSQQKTIYCFKYAEGGSSVDWNYSPNWYIPNGSQPGGGANWSALVTNLSALKEWELANGFTITKMRLLWVQAEKDAQTAGSAALYESLWTNFLTGVPPNSIFSSKIVPSFYIQPYLYDVLLSVNANATTMPYISDINTAKSNVQATNTTYYRVINSDAYDFESGNVHYSKAGFETMANDLFNLINLDGF